MTEKTNPGSWNVDLAKRVFNVLYDLCIPLILAGLDGQ